MNRVCKWGWAQVSHANLRSDDAYHTVPHTLMFVQAEETMRRFFNPDHLAYGDAIDLYERMVSSACTKN